MKTFKLNQCRLALSHHYPYPKGIRTHQITINVHSYYPLKVDSFVPGYIVDVETSLQDVIDVLKEDDFANLFAIGLELLYRKLDLRTRANGHLLPHAHHLTSLASMVGLTTKKQRAPYKLELMVLREL